VVVGVGVADVGVPESTQANGNSARSARAVAVVTTFIDLTMDLLTHMY
jgi:hypothetical protein